MTTKELSNYEAALAAERKRVVRCFQHYSSEQCADHAASHRVGARKRNSIGEFYYVHPDVPGIAFASRGQAATHVLHKAEGYRP